MKRLRLDAAARAELLHQTQYYKDIRPRLGKSFREAVDDLFGKIKQKPNGGKPDEQACRRLRTQGLPFSVVWRDEGEEIVVYPIRGDSREPGYWLGRIPSSP